MGTRTNKQESLDIYKVAFPFSVYLCQIVKNFDRGFKFVVGDDIIKAANAMRRYIIAANNEVNKGKSARLVYECLNQADIIDDLTSLALELGQISIEQKAICDTNIIEIKNHGKRWRKYFLRINGQSADSDMESAESL